MPLNHVALTVTDWERSAEFYARQFGLIERVEHDGGTLLVHLSDEDGRGWTVLAVDRATRQWAVAQQRRQLDAAREAYGRLYPNA